jgi:quercetin dioxygenase-like cupin family protein
MKADQSTVRLVVAGQRRSVAIELTAEGSFAGDGGYTRQEHCRAASVKRWDLRSLAPSSKKQVARAPGVDAPRIPRTGSQMPRVLFTSPECRAVVIDLREGEELGDHRVRERAVVEVVAGRVSIECSGETADCDTGTLVTFDPGEHHKVRALADARLLLILAPWPALKHNSRAENDHDQHLPANAVAEPVPPSDEAAEQST